MDGNQRMITWSSAWALVGGLAVCTGCMRSQSVALSEAAFIHEPNCVAKDDEAERPWVELHEILDYLRG